MDSFGLRRSLASFLSHLKNPEQYKVVVPGVLEHDFKFYFIPAHVERAQGKSHEKISSFNPAIHFCFNQSNDN